MPLIPFFGISIIVHIILILVYHLFHLPPRTYVLPTKTNAFRNWAGLLVILGVFGFVLVSATLLVRASIMERHSSFNYVRNHSEYFNHANNHLKQITYHKSINK